MTHVDAAQLARARALLALEDGPGSALRVYDKLHQRLTPLIGAVGVEMIFLRSARLTGGTFAALADVPSHDRAALLRARLTDGSSAASDDVVQLLGTFLALLTVFIGERLTIQLLRAAWPTLEVTVET